MVSTAVPVTDSQPYRRRPRPRTRSRSVPDPFPGHEIPGPMSLLTLRPRILAPVRGDHSAPETPARLCCVFHPRIIRDPRTRAHSRPSFSRKALKRRRARCGNCANSRPIPIRLAVLAVQGWRCLRSGDVRLSRKAHRNDRKASRAHIARRSDCGRSELGRDDGYPVNRHQM